MRRKAPQPDPSIVAGTDYWLRHILENNAVRQRELQVKTQYLIKIIDEVTGKSWQAETSRRLRSKASDVKLFAVAEADRINKPGIYFRFLLMASVEDLRANPDIDVFFDPTDRDRAHANLIFMKIPYISSEDPTISPRISQEFLKRLADNMRVLPEAEVDF